MSHYGWFDDAKTELVAQAVVVEDGGGGGDTSGLLPAGSTPASVTDEPNTYAGDGTFKLVRFATTDDVGLAFGVEGEDFPRWVFMADSEGGIYAGDGTTDPIDGSANLWMSADGFSIGGSNHGTGINLGGANPAVILCGADGAPMISLSSTPGAGLVALSGNEGSVGLDIVTGDAQSTAPLAIAGPNGRVFAVQPDGAVAVAGGPATGPMLPIADPTGVTIETADNTVTGSGTIDVLTFPADTPAFAIKVAGDAFPRWMFLSDSTDGLYFGDGTSDPYSGSGATIGTDGTRLLLNGTGGVKTNGDLTFNATGAGPIINDASDGHTYRLICTNGVFSAEEVT
jgi:hypothetical protein